MTGFAYCQCRVVYHCRFSESRVQIILTNFLVVGQLLAPTNDFFAGAAQEDCLAWLFSTVLFLSTGEEMQNFHSGRTYVLKLRNKRTLYVTKGGICLDNPVRYEVANL
jgi:hypothetical protein